MNVGPDQPTDLSAFDPQTNRLVATWADYDAAGNQIEFKYPGVSNCNRRFADYDANNKMWAYSRPVDIGGSQSPNCPDLGNRSAVAVYQYDGQGNRVSKAEAGVTTTYVYDAFGHLAAEYSSQAPSGGGRFFRTTDHLGSTRLVTDEGGNVVARRDFFPFGEQIPASSTYGNRNLVTDGQGNTTYNDGSAFSQQFTAKERDDESSLDYFPARYLSASLGRFNSPDPLFFQKEMLVDPQRFNLYSYVRNTPLLFVDPSGERIQLTGTTEEEREAQLEAIRSTVGSEAGAQLVSRRDSSDGNYYVEITGDAAAFAETNSVAADFATIIGHSDTAKFSFAASHDLLPFGFALSQKRAVGATARDDSGQLWVFVLRPQERLPPAERSQFDIQGFWSNLWYLTGVPRTMESNVGHEFGHALDFMQYREFDRSRSNRNALKLENKVRQLHDPGSPVRVRHPGGLR